MQREHDKQEMWCPGAEGRSETYDFIHSFLPPTNKPLTIRHTVWCACVSQTPWEVGPCSLLNTQLFLVVKGPLRFQKHSEYVSMCCRLSTFVSGIHRMCDGKTHHDGKAVAVPSGRGVLEKHLLLVVSGGSWLALLGVASSDFPGHGDVKDLTSVLPCS